MTGNANPLVLGDGRKQSRPAFVTVENEQVPTEIDAYCLFLNAKEKRRGRWAVVIVNGTQTVDWRPQQGSDGWIAERVAEHR